MSEIPKKIIPRHNWVLVKPVEVKTENEFGLSIPDSVEKEQKAQGEVIALGPETPADLKKGQIVIYGVYAGEDLQFAGKHEVRDKIDYKLLLDEDIIAIIEW